jgi:hypothetical protein
MSKDTVTFRIRELDPDMIAPPTKNMNKPEQGGSKIVIIGKPGCFTKGTLVMMYDGTLKNVEDIKVGDVVMGDDCTPRNVQELCFGKENMYRIRHHNDDGEPYIVNETHKLVFKKNGELVEMEVKNYINQSDEWKSDCCIYRQIVSFPEKKTMIRAYDAGQLCGLHMSHSIHPSYMYTSKEKRIDFLKGFFEQYKPCYSDYACALCEKDDKKCKMINDLDFMRKSLGLFWNEHSTSFSVSFVEYGDYYGFTLDGNHRFLLGSCDVVRNTGKTTMITSLLYEKSHIFPVGEVMSGTEDSNGHYGKIFPSTFVYNALDKSKIEDFIKRQKIAKQHLPNPWAVLLLDDCTDDPKLFNDPMFQGIFKNGRHWKMLFILSLQYSLDIKPVIRTNVDGTFILRETNLRNRRSLWENYAGVFPDFDQFCQVLDQITDDYTALYIHNATTSNKVEDCVFWYKAKPIPQEFRMGCEDYWDFHNERYNTEMDKLV